MKTVFLSYPMHGKTKEQMNRSKSYMINAFESIWPDEKFNYISNENCHMNEKTFKKIGGDEKASRLWYLGEAIKQIGHADVVLLHPDWMKSKGCVVEARAAEAYDICVYELDQWTNKFDDRVWVTLSDIGLSKMYEKVLRLIKMQHIWTINQFVALTDDEINDFMLISGVGKKTVDAIKKVKDILESEGE